MLLGYQPRLDGVRAVAVGLVVQQHFVGVLQTGALGVRMFFVLSGYLISRIILDYKLREIPIHPAARQFYWRRMLRLSPPLLIAISLTTLFGVANMRQDWPWHILYLTNVKVYLDQSFGPATTFWSLAVEEQFYLVWFFVMMIVPLRHTLVVIISGIIVGISYRAVAAMIGSGWEFVLLPGTLDYFCLGAMIAYAECVTPQVDTAVLNSFSHPFFVVASLVIVIVAAIPNDPVVAQARYIADDLFSFCVVIAARNGPQGRYLSWLLSPAFVRHIGKISYGIYVYHFFLPQVLDRFGLLSMIRALPAGAVLKLLTELTITFAVAELSWRMIERPIMKLKPLVGLKRVDAVRSGVGRIVRTD